MGKGRGVGRGVVGEGCTLGRGHIPSLKTREIRVKGTRTGENMRRGRGVVRGGKGRERGIGDVFPLSNK